MHPRSPPPDPWRRRSQLLLLTLLALYVGLGARLFELQVRQGDELAREAQNLSTVRERTWAPRGRILDRHGQVLAASQPRFQLEVIPGEVSDPTTLSQALGYDVSEVLERSMQQDPWQPLTLSSSVPWSAVARILKLTRHVRGLSLVTRTLRRYPQGRLACHVLGYLGEITAAELMVLRSKGYRLRDYVGQSGLESHYDWLLRGVKGMRTLQVDAMGKTLKVVKERPPVPGADLHLTLDARLQRLAESLLAKQATPGSVVMLRVRTGQVLALASLPLFDPAPFARGIGAGEYHRLLNDPNVPLLFRATQAAFPPGSTFKVVLASAALQERVITPASNFYCGGWYKGFHCFVQSGHGRLDFPNFLALSCDVVAYELGDSLGMKRISRYARAFGLGSPTRVDLTAEDGGYFPRRAEGWWETINASIGQGTVLATPLQMAVVAATVGNGGRLYRPYLVDRATDVNGKVVWRQRPHLVRRVPVKPEFLKAVREGMRGAVDHGTAVAANSQLVEISGKTGTAEAVPSRSNPEGKNHTWFICFAPYEKPEVALAVMVERSGGFGGGVCAPIARELIEAYFGPRMPARKARP